MFFASATLDKNVQSTRQPMIGSGMCCKQIILVGRIDGARIESHRDVSPHKRPFFPGSRYLIHLT